MKPFDHDCDGPRSNTSHYVNVLHYYLSMHLSHSDVPSFLLWCMCYYDCLLICKGFCVLQWTCVAVWCLIMSALGISGYRRQYIRHSCVTRFHLFSKYGISLVCLAVSTFSLFLRFPFYQLYAYMRVIYLICESNILNCNYYWNSCVTSVCVSLKNFLIFFPFRCM
jgi:hypothetical protein